MKKILTIILAIGLIATFTACNNKGQQSGDKTNQSGEQNKSEGTILSIEGNPTTGYTWHPSGYDSSIIKVEDLETETLKQEANENHNTSGESGEENNLVGTPSIFRFKITGLKEGSTALAFDYYRSWEGSESTIETKEYMVTVDNILNVVVTEKVNIDDEIPSEDDFLPSAEMETLVNDLVSKSGVQFPMAATSKILLVNAPTFVGLSEELYKTNVVDSAVYEPMISPATSSMCIVKFSDTSDVATLKQTILDNCNPAKWICTSAEKCLVIESGRYVMLVMSTSENCEALKNAFVEHFGANNVGKALTKDGASSDINELPPEM